jgi:hypothetical protein
LFILVVLMEMVVWAGFERKTASLTLLRLCAAAHNEASIGNAGASNTSRTGGRKQRQAHPGVGPVPDALISAPLSSYGIATQSPGQGHGRDARAEHIANIIPQPGEIG